ncbi:MAG: MBL fold metallo-hydrolase [Candidatus Omnitrophica bacterium]|nr:MBL fold metallo-hydrolase [Candidatus Omnitrophota bacterium]
MMIKFLGTGDPLGMPVISCKCHYCQIACRNKTRQRLRPSILLQENNVNILFDISPDIRIQLLNANIKGLSRIFVTHAHFDHLYGIVDLFQLNYIKKVRIPIYVNRDTLKFIKKYYPWINLKFIVYKNSKKYKFNGIEVIPLQVEHSKKFTTNGFIIRKEKRKIIYFPDFKNFTNKSSFNLSKKADTAIFDGQYILGKYIKDPEHLGGKNLIKIINKLDARKIFLMGVSEHWYKKTEEEILKYLPKNFIIPRDGLAIRV